MKDLVAFSLLTITEVIGCLLAAMVLAVAYGCSLSTVITVPGALAIVLLCVGFSVIGVGLSKQHNVNIRLKRQR